MEVFRGFLAHTDLLHHSRYCNSHQSQRLNQSARDHGYGGHQELLLFFIGLGENVMTVIEVVEELRQLEDIFRRVGGLGGGDGELDD